MPKYLPSAAFESSTVQIDWNRPEEVKSSREQLEELKEEIEAGLTSTVRAIAKRQNISLEEAKLIKQEIDMEEGLNGLPAPEIEEEGSQPDV